MQLIRFFVALEISESSKSQIEVVQRKLKQTIPQVNLTDPEKFHLTIAFVGEESGEMKEPLVKVITKAVWGVNPFEVTPAYIDGFPKLHRPHTFWIGVKGDTDKLFVIRERVKDGLEKLHIPTDERRYVPHIAIGKVNKDFELKPHQEVELEKIVSVHFDPIRIESIKLFESIPNHGFHSHNTLAEVKLGTKLPDPALSLG